MSLACKQCGTARPKNTLPLDIMFPLYVPVNTAVVDKDAVNLNFYTSVFEKLLNIIPLVESNNTLSQMLKDIKKKEKEKSTKDFDKIDIID